PMDVVIRYREHLISNRAELDLAHDIAAKTPQQERRLIQRFYLSQDAMGQRAKQSGEHTVGQQFTAIMRRYDLPAPETALQDRVNGWRFMYNCLWQASGLRGREITKEQAENRPAFFVTSECPAAITHIPQALRAEKNIEDVERIAGEVWEDVCLAAGTLVMCEQGEVSIESVTPGMRVWTRQGLRAVLRSWMTRKDAAIVEARFSNGKP